MSLRAACVVVAMVAASCAAAQSESGNSAEEAGRINARLAMEYLKRDQLQVAQEKIVKALAQNPRDVQLLQQIVGLAEAEGDFTSAAKYQQQHLAVAPTKEAESKLAQLLARSGETDEASSIWVRLVTREQDPYRVIQAIDSLLQGVTDTTERRRIAREYNASHPVPHATLAQVADHIEHARQVAGVDHVGIGSDFDGIDAGPDGLEDVSKFPALFAELIRRGWSDADLKKLAGENVLRVLRQAEAVAKKDQAERQPSTKTIQELDAQ